MFSWKMTKIISLTNLFQHLPSAEILSESKIEFILPYLVRNFQINARNKLTTKCLLTFSHYTRPHLEYGTQVYVKNKLCSHIIFYFTILYHSLFKPGPFSNYKSVAIV